MNQAPLSLAPIVVADDSEDDVFFVRRILEAAGAPGKFVVVNSGQQAVQLLQHGAAEIVRVLFLDINMPGMDGLEVLKWVKSEPRLTHVKVVMLSHSDDPSDIERARRLGAHNYVVKYPSPAKAAEVLRDVLPGVSTKSSDENAKGD